MVRSTPRSPPALMQQSRSCGLGCRRHIRSRQAPG
jgi:hypothetical protein